MTKKRDSNYTEMIIVLLWLVYLLQFIIFEDFASSFATSPSDLFNSNFYTLLTSIFLHGSLIHLLSNSIALFIFGRVVEKHIGAKIFLVFILGGIIANIISHIISFLINDMFSSWGASGAIATIILLSILFEPLARLFFVIPIFILGWLTIYGDLIGLFRDDNINQLAHLGGYIGSFLILSFIEKTHIEKAKKGFLINIVLIILLFIIIYLF